MKNNRLNMHKPTKMAVLQNQNPRISLKNLLVLPLIHIFLVFGLNANSYAIQEKVSMSNVLANMSETANPKELGAQKIEVAFNQEDRQQLRDEMRQQWGANGDAANQKAWKQMGTEDRERMRRDMIQTAPVDVQQTANQVRR